jgi:hypothetical protein
VEPEARALLASAILVATLEYYSAIQGHAEATLADRLTLAKSNNQALYDAVCQLLSLGWTASLEHGVTLRRIVELAIGPEPSSGEIHCTKVRRRERDGTSQRGEIVRKTASAASRAYQKVMSADET